MKSQPLVSTFNRGRISPRALGRPDVDRVNLSAEVMTNWLPGKLGYMSFRPGTEFISEANPGIFVPFIFSREDFAAIQISAANIRIWDQGETLVSRGAVSAAITNGGFGSDISGWTDDSDAGGTISHLSGALRISGTGYAAGAAYQEVTISEQGETHALRVEILRGPVLLRIGTVAGLDNVLEQKVLRTGEHSLEFTPNSASVFVHFSSALKYPVLVDRVAIEGAGEMAIPSPWDEADLPFIRHEQINDVVYLACDGYPPRMIERREGNSWSLVEYAPKDGPFLDENTEAITLTPSAIQGSIDLTASRALFRDEHVGALFRMTSAGQEVSADLSAESTYSNAINVQGAGSDSRAFRLVITGTWSGTLTLSRSIGAEGAWTAAKTFNANTDRTIDDNLDNAIAYYRVGFEGGDYASGTANVRMEYDGGSINGVARITGVSGRKDANAIVLKDLGGTEPMAIWAEGAWSDAQTWPTSVAMYEGRLAWQGKGRNWLSVSDGLDSFDPDFEGDAGPISKYIGDGSVDRANWALPMQRLLIGTDDAEFSVRASSIDEVLTSANYNSKQFGSQGSAPIQAVRMDNRAVMIAGGGRRIVEMDFAAQANDYVPVDLSVLVPEIGDPGITRIAVKNNPSSSLYCVRSDGTVAVMVRDPAEDVRGFVDLELSGFAEDVFVLPGDEEDRVYFLVRYEINGETVRHLERMALESDCRGGDISRNLDSHVVYDGAPTATLAAAHLEGETVSVWGNGADLGTFTVAGGEVSLPAQVSRACLGLPYEARYKSAPLVPFFDGGALLGQEKRIDYVGARLLDTHWQGLEFGPSFDSMDGLPWEGRAEEYTIEGGEVVAGDSTFPKPMLPFPGGWSLDERICLKASSPRPCTVLAIVGRQDSSAKW